MNVYIAVLWVCAVSLTSGNSETEDSVGNVDFLFGVRGEKVFANVSKVYTRTNGKAMPHFKVKFHVKLHNENKKVSNATRIAVFRRLPLEPQFQKETEAYLLKARKNGLFQWQQFLANDKFRHFCPVVVMDPTTVLSSQSCTQAFTRHKMDELFLSKDYPRKEVVQQWQKLKKTSPKVVQRIIHPEFKKLDDGEILNDLVLLKMNRNIYEPTEKGNSFYICLPVYNKSAMTDSFTRSFIQLFWTDQAVNESKESHIMLMKTTRLSKENDNCVWNLRHAFRVFPIRRICTTILPEDNFCPENIKARTTGSLVEAETKNDRLILAGIFTYGEEICKAAKVSTEVSVFSRLDQYAAWVNSNISPAQVARCYS